MHDLSLPTFVLLVHAQKTDGDTKLLTGMCRNTSDGQEADPMKAAKQELLSSELTFTEKPQMKCKIVIILFYCLRWDTCLVLNTAHHLQAEQSTG